MDLVVTFIIFVIFCLSFYLHLRHLYSYWECKGVPFIKPKIPFGNIKGFKDELQFALLIDRFYKKFKGNGSVIGGIYFLWKPFVIAMDVNFIKQILITDFKFIEDRGLYYNEKDDPLSAHMFAIDSDKWRQLRRKVSPTFTSGKMKQMCPLVLDVADRLKKHADLLIGPKNDVELKSMAAKYTIDVIGTCAFGIECNSLENKNNNFWIMGSRAFNDRKLSFPMALLLATFRKQANIFRIKFFKPDVSEFFSKLTQDTVEYREKHNIHRKDFMDMLIDLKNDPHEPISMNELSAQAFLFFIAGYDSSSGTIGYILYELAKNPDVYEKTKFEIDQILQNHGGKLTYEALMDMNYLSHVIFETLRVHPIVGQLIRRVTKDYKIPETDIILPKGMSIIIPTYSLHYDPDIFPDPEKFIPERFASNRSEYDKYRPWLPFGDGPRNCVGLRFGIMVIKIGIVTLLSQYRPSICAKTMNPITYSSKSILMYPEKGMWLNMERNK